MPPSSSNFPGALGEGAMSGLVTSEDKARDRELKREQTSLQMTAQLVQAGWTPLDPVRGSKTGKAMFFPLLGVGYEPPEVDKAAEHQLKIQESKDRVDISRMQMDELSKQIALADAKLKAIPIS